MNIMELLRYQGYPVTWVQGHHTRLVCYDNGEFEVFTPKDTLYTESHYRGDQEDKAVAVFIDCENNDYGNN
jgi:hypothetical protein